MSKTATVISEINSEVPRLMANKCTSANRHRCQEQDACIYGDALDRDKYQTISKDDATRDTSMRIQTDAVFSSTIRCLTLCVRCGGQTTQNRPSSRECEGAEIGTGVLYHVSRFCASLFYGVSSCRPLWVWLDAALDGGDMTLTSRDRSD